MTWKTPSPSSLFERTIATVFVAAGYNVNIRDPSEQARADALHYIDESKRCAGFNALPHTTSAAPGSYAAYPDIDSAVRDAWLVIEAVPEKLELKIVTMAELDEKAPADCIFGSNSSSFRSGLMSKKVSEQRKAQILNVHFTMPPMINKIELMTDGVTDPAVIQCVKGFLEGCGMIPVVARRESTGFIFNRLWAAIKREILFILAEDVSTPEEIEKLWTNVCESRIAAAMQAYGPGRFGYCRFYRRQLCAGARAGYSYDSGLASSTLHCSRKARPEKA
jgi:3-hydroxyacyl-CoA dehydrogenase